jgi:molecular chaperone GrpE
MKKQAEEWKNKYMRALADYQNLERRTREEKEEIRKYAAEIILGRLLPVVDIFTKVKEHVKDPGFDLAYKELHAVLQEQGVEHIAVVGHEFNPHEMECIEVVNGKENIVTEESLPGYRIHGKILRVAQVKVGKEKV